MKRKLATLLILLAAGIAAWLVLREHLTLEQLVAHEDRFRSLIDQSPLIGFAAGFAAYSLVCLVPGTTGKSLIMGWLFGFWQGLLIVNLGLTVAAVTTFLLSRYLLRDVLHSRWGIRLKRLDDAIQRDGAFYVFALRMMHAPYSVTNYAMGTTCITLTSFWWSTQLGMLAGNIVFVYAGTQFPTLEEAAREGLGAVFSPGLIAAFVLVGVLPLSARWVIRRVWTRGRRNSA